MSLLWDVLSSMKYDDAFYGSLAKAKGNSTAPYRFWLCVGPKVKLQNLSFQILAIRQNFIQKREQQHTK